MLAMMMKVARNDTLARWRDRRVQRFWNRHEVERYQREREAQRLMVSRYLH